MLAGTLRIDVEFPDQFACQRIERTEPAVSLWSDHLGTPVHQYTHSLHAIQAAIGRTNLLRHRPCQPYIHLASQVVERPLVVTLDTGRLPEETHQVMQQFRQRYPIRLRVLAPEGVPAPPAWTAPPRPPGGGREPLSFSDASQKRSSPERFCWCWPVSFW